MEHKVVEFQVPGLKFKDSEKASNQGVSRKGREVRKGTELKPQTTRNTLKEKNRKPRNRRTTRKETRISRINAEFHNHGSGQMDTDGILLQKSSEFLRQHFFESYSPTGRRLVLE